MNRKTIGLMLSLVLLLVVSTTGCITTNPSSIMQPTTEPPVKENEVVSPPEGVSIPPLPEVTPEILSVWKAEPPSETYLPDMSGEIELQPNKAGEKNGEVNKEGVTMKVIATEGSHQDSEVFYLGEGQWIDIVVSSIDVPVYYLIEKPDAMTFQTVYWAEIEGKRVRSTHSANMGIFAPFYGKLLYENRISRTDKGTMFTTASRVFAWGGAGDYCISFMNFSTQKSCQIIYRIYKDGTTPDWGHSYEDEKLQPWLDKLYQLHTSGKISQAQYDEAESQWLEQFK
jgi:hypothetical protein